MIAYAQTDLKIGLSESYEGSEMKVRVKRFGNNKEQIKEQNIINQIF